MDKKVKAFLDVVADHILKNTASAILGGLDGKKFQDLVTETALTLNETHGYGLEVRPTAPQAFPDLVVNRTGVEIKATVKDHWITTGNSISETRRDKEIDEIVFFFGKLGGKPQILIRPYDDCLSSVVVTHNPRYTVDMRLAPEDSIFSKMGLSYEEFRTQENPIRFVRDYVKKNLKPGEELWWIGEGDSGDAASPILRQIGAGNTNERLAFRALAFAMRPEVISSSAKKYERLPALLLKHFGAVSPSMRDFFSAGGVSTITDEVGSEIEVTAAHKRLLELAPKVKQIILDADDEQLLYGWRVDKIEIDRVAQYCQIISKIGVTQKSDYDLGKLFLAAA